MSIRQKVSQQSVLTAKCPYGEVYLRWSVFTAKCPHGELSLQQNVSKAKWPYGKLPVRSYFIRRNALPRKILRRKVQQRASPPLRDCCLAHFARVPPMGKPQLLNHNSKLWITLSRKFKHFLFVKWETTFDTKKINLECHKKNNRLSCRNSRWKSNIELKIRHEIICIYWKKNLR